MFLHWKLQQNNKTKIKIAKMKDYDRTILEDCKDKRSLRIKKQKKKWTQKKGVKKIWEKWKR
jgi:hypothetical protein